MANPRPLVYTVRKAVRVTAAQYEALRRYATEQDTAVSIVMREAALEAIGRSDLSVAEETAFPIGDMLARKDRRPPRRGNRASDVTVVCNLTERQHAALERYADKQQVGVSAVLRDAGLERAGVAAALPRPTTAKHPGKELGAPWRSPRGAGRARAR